MVTATDRASQAARGESLVPPEDFDSFALFEPVVPESLDFDSEDFESFFESLELSGSPISPCPCSFPCRGSR